MAQVVQEGDAFDLRQVLEPQRVADLHPAHIGVDRLRHLHRQRLHVEHTGGRREDTALAHAGSVLGADQVNGDRCLDRLVEADLLQVDVLHMTANRIALVLLEDGRVRVRLALQHHVEHGVQARRAGQGGAEQAAFDGERVSGPLAVEDARNEALLAQAPRLGRAEPLTFLHIEAKSVSGHGRGV